MKIRHERSILKRVFLVLGYAGLLLSILLVGTILVVRLQASRQGKNPAYRTGELLGRLLPGAPHLVPYLLCRANPGDTLSLCLRGFYTSKYSSPPSSIRNACPTSPREVARTCSEAVGLVMGRNLYPQPLRDCTLTPDPLACARYVGRAAFSLGGFSKGEHSARTVCGAANDADLLAHCRTGASMEAVERYGLPILRASEENCSPYDYGLCLNGIISSIQSITKGDRERYTKACQQLSLRGAALCLQRKQSS